MRLNLLSESAVKILDSLGIFLKLPSSLANQYPSVDGDKSPPHITVLYVGDVDASRKSEILKIIRKVCSNYKPMEVWVGGLAYFTNQKGEEIAHSMVEAQALAAISQNIWDELLRQGFSVDNSFIDYTPHVTLQYGSKRDYNGLIPEGSFKATELEIWAGDGNKLGVAKFS